ncbi:hypothetical protein Q8A73_005732 [Channa argus]|nr:hypothetical protein Q8A73_005732 [Channa argus]
MCGGTFAPEGKAFKNAFDHDIWTFKAVLHSFHLLIKRLMEAHCGKFTGIKTISPVAGGGKPQMQGRVEICGEDGDLLLSSSPKPPHNLTSFFLVFVPPCT